MDNFDPIWNRFKNKVHNLVEEDYTNLYLKNTLYIINNFEHVAFGGFTYFERGGKMVGEKTIL